MVRLLGAERCVEPQKNEAAPGPGEWFRRLPRGTRLATFCSVPRPFPLVACALLLAAACGQETPSTVTGADAGPPPPDAAPVAQGDEARGVVAINEVANDSPGGTADWIELRAADVPGAATVDLSGFYLSDAPDRLDHFYRFPAGTTLAPGAYLVVFADGGQVGEGHHAPFKLSREDGVYLLDPDGVVIDSLLFLGEKDGRTLARHPDGVGRFFLATATPGGANP